MEVPAVITAATAVDDYVVVDVDVVVDVSVVTLAAPASRSC